MTPQQFGAVLGFAFVAAWTGLGFGYAILCLVGAGVFYVAANFLEESDLDLSDIQSRLSPGSSAQPTAPSPPRSAAPKRARVR